jgi:hypothetical protein
LRIKQREGTGLHGINHLRVDQPPRDIGGVHTDFDRLSLGESRE